MKIDRIKHIQFLKDELKAQTDDFKQTLETSAVDLLLDKNKVFVAIFLGFHANGEMLLKFTTSRPLPRRNDYLYCFTLPESLRRYKDWGSRTYGELIKSETRATEVKCIWHSTSDNPKFMLAGFRGVSEEFKKYVEKAPGGIVTLGPQVPPFEYLENLQKVASLRLQKCSQILDADYNIAPYNSILVSAEQNLSEIVLNAFDSNNIVVVEGPPGTGKTFRIANLCEELCRDGHSVLVTALTNRALMEVAAKLKNSNLMSSNKIFKTNLSSDESKEEPKLNSLDTVQSMPGNLVLSTFYTTSGVASKFVGETYFDYVIVDEASQAFLPMLAAANILGEKNLWVGDVRQMPPIVTISKDRISRMGYIQTIEGLETIVSSNKYPTFQLKDSFRLGKRAVTFTGMFYNNTLSSLSKLNNALVNDGPIVIPLKMPVGDLTPKNAIQKVVSLARDLCKQNKDIEIAILSLQITTTKALQVEIAKEFGNTNKILVDTVARIQGLTRDFTIYVIPDTDTKIHSLELRLFNVATSRATRNTYIICPADMLEFQYMNPLVREFIEKAWQDISV